MFTPIRKKPSPKDSWWPCNLGNVHDGDWFEHRPGQVKWYGPILLSPIRTWFSGRIFFWETSLSKLTQWTPTLPHGILGGSPCKSQTPSHSHPVDSLMSNENTLRSMEHLGFWIGTVDGWNPSNLLRLVVFPIIYRVSYNPGGDRRISEPSPEVPMRNWHRHFSRTSISLLFPFLGESSISSPVS